MRQISRNKNGMRHGWPLLGIFCTLTLAACGSTATLSERNVPAGLQLGCMERQEVELQSCLARYNGTEIEKREGCICITIARDTFFESNSDVIEPASCTEIDTVAEVVKKYPETQIKVDVHTDCVRSEEQNIALSELQAWTIKKALVDRGVAASQVTARGWGESRPVASNATEAGRKVNRRITIMLTAPDQS
ncbi:MAG: OmpA family protein [Syntrophobacteraceae bacterium]